jgi:hypothetical protein
MLLIQGCKLEYTKRITKLFQIRIKHEKGEEKQQHFLKNKNELFFIALLIHTRMIGYIRLGFAYCTSCGIYCMTATLI